MSSIEETIAVLPEKSLLLLDDDGPLRNRLGRALESRGFETTLVESVSEALTAVRSRPPAFGSARHAARGRHRAESGRGAA